MGDDGIDVETIRCNHAFFNPQLLTLHLLDDPCRLGAEHYGYCYRPLRDKDYDYYQRSEMDEIMR